MPKRSIIYIDGFNFFYGSLQGGPYKWLDLEKFFVKLRQDDEIQAIKYFTAEVSGSPSQRQSIYLQALLQRSLIQIILGKYKRRDTTCTVTTCSHALPRIFKKPEEKQTDVNIAIEMLDDAYQKCCDRLIVVSGDSDLIPAMAKIKQRFPSIEIIVYIPARSRFRGASVEIRAHADKARTLPLDLLKHSQFPAQVPDGAGGWLQKPSSW